MTYPLSGKAIRWIYIFLLHPLQIQFSHQRASEGISG